MTGDVIDDFLSSGIDVTFCGGYAGVVWADVDGDGTYDTQVVFETLTGEAIVTHEFTPPGLWYFFSFIRSVCGGGNADRGRIRIRFVDILAAGFVWNNPATWLYKSVPALALKTTHDEITNSSPNPYLGVNAYKNLNQIDPVDGPHTPEPNNWILHRFSDAAGIKEIYVSSDFAENTIDELILYNTPQSWPPSGVPVELVMLFDTSGSMSWSPQGQMFGVPVDAQRITLAKRAAIPFLELLGDYDTGTEKFGIATFPAHPWSQFNTCQGQVVTPLALSNDANINTAILVTIPSLVTEDNTPLLAGLGTAKSMLEPGTKAAIILLSDGYHNCPSFMDPGDPQVTQIISQLIAQSTKVHTIGFGLPTDIDHPLLQAFAQQTGGTFYDVTTPDFDPATWDPATALQTTYKNILVDLLGLEPIADPYEIVSFDRKLIREVHLSEHDQKVSFYLGWVKPQIKGLCMRIRSSDGDIVPVTGPEVIYHQGATHEILTVKKEFLRRAGKVGPKPWQVEIDGSGLAKGTSEKCQYAVISDSNLRMKVHVEIPSIETAKRITLKAELLEAGKPMKGLKSIHVRVSRPQQGIGNWYSKNKITPATMKKISTKKSQEKLPPRLQKAMYLAEVRKAKFLGPIDSGEVKLFDDGTHGDAKANDGIYTATFENTKIEGSYAFHFVAEGLTRGGHRFKREHTVKKYLRALFSSEMSDIKVDRVKGDSTLQSIKVTIVPKDSAGNYVGPGYAKAIAIIPSWGKTVTEIQDNIDGTYSQIFEVPTSVVSKTELAVTMEGKTKSVKLNRRGKK